MAAILGVFGGCLDFVMTDFLHKMLPNKILDLYFVDRLH